MGDVADSLIVADTDVLIDFLRGHEPGRSRVEGWLRDGFLRTTAITAFELRLGADFVRPTGMAALLARRTLPLDLLSALRAGEAQATLRAAGTTIGVRDALIAGICLRFDLPLATRNVRHFARVDGLRLVPQ
jgi:tRNA(fMet)-specific endonuclease VapC